MRASIESFLPANLPTAPVRSIFGEIGTFFAVGFGAMLGFIALSSLVLSLPTGLPAWLASALCYAACILPVYLLHRRFSFASDVPHRQALPRYVAVQGMAMLLATLFSFVAYGVLSAPTVIASIVVITLTSGINFVVLRFWAFMRPGLGH